MANIKVLEDELINKIAAGEVIERPASVVKELIENSLDADATNLTIDIKEGGKSYIKVVDNGTGMSQEDAMLSIQRHATSKISSSSDLFSIRTLGFRGEALASMAAVSRLKITTKSDGIEGTKIIVEGGNIVSHGSIGCTQGTTMIVEDLFFNTPARKKYLKTISTELSKIIDVVTRYALANPQVSFKLVHNHRLILNSPKTTNTLSNITYIYGRDTAKKLLAVNYATNDIEIMGFVSKPELTRNNKDQQSLFVNKRYIRNQVITDALNEAYHTLLPVGKSPVAILNITLNPKDIDVNVHPTKTEIRIQNESLIHEAVLEAVKKTLQSTELIPEMEEKNFSFQDFKTEIRKDKQSLLSPKESEVKVEFIKIEKSKLPEMIVLGQINKTYIITESGSGLMIIDQHAAEERVNYEYFMKNKGNIETQSLIQPDVIELNLNDANELMENLELFEKLGFKIEEFGNNSFVVRTVPSILGKIQTKELLLDMLSGLENKPAEIREKALTYAACRASVKAGDELTLPQMKDLIERLNNTEQPYTCPHGRPTVISMPVNELEKKFKRVM